MKRLKKIMRLCGLLLIIVLASMGMALSGAAPVSSNKRGDYLDNEIKTEMPEGKEEEADKAEEIGIQ